MTKFKKVTIVIIILLVLFLSYEFFAPATGSLQSVSISVDTHLDNVLNDTDNLNSTIENNYIWNINAINSTDYKDYRMIEFRLKIKNPTFYKIVYTDFEIIAAEKLPNRFALSYRFIKPFTIDRMDSQKCTFRILMNTKGLSNVEIEEAIRGLTIQSTKSYRVIAGELRYPSYKMKLGIPDDIAFISE